ncbi:hypothetical protein [Burkholderia multivorans]|uniref:hypothetical protein n=1 Tax=Burkholderia multivorans TaxID=87883 RepID=UPI0020B256B8|nr:hypothetical protein [Burkholderia multivorans]
MYDMGVSPCAGAPRRRAAVRRDAVGPPDCLTDGGRCHARTRPGTGRRAQSVLDYNDVRVARIRYLPGGRLVQRRTARDAPSDAARAHASMTGYECCSRAAGAWCNCIKVNHATALFTGHAADAILTALSFARLFRTPSGSDRVFFIRRAAPCGGAVGPSGKRIETGFET